jgi:iron complex transport system ATP-binding protein
MDLHTAESHTPALAFDAVTFGYQSNPVVREVTLEIAPGEMVGLLGPNGAGKSTLLRLGAGTLSAQSGHVRLGTDDIRGLSRREVARRVAVAPQDFSVQFAYTVRQIVEMGRTPHRGLLYRPGREDALAIEAAMAAAGVTHLADRVFNDLSGGERQRVVIALTVAQEAPLLLLDEPTAHLDIRYQIEALELLRRLNGERGLTVVAALHDLNLAARYFPRLVLFQQTIVADGSPAQVLDADLLFQVYETPVRVGILRGEQHLSVLPPGRDERGDTVVWQAERPASDSTIAAVHVIAGGGSGELMMRALADAGVPFSAGPLNIGDSDYALAQRLAALSIAEPPYAPVSAEGLAAARERMRDAQAIIVCPTPLGQGNVALLEAVLAACEAGHTVVLLEPGATSASWDDVLGQVTGRDFTGRGAVLYRALWESGAQLAASPSEALRHVLLANHK